MIKKLQKKFIIITMQSILLVLLIIIGAINAVNIYRMDSKSSQVINMLSENEGRFPELDKKRAPHPKPFGFEMNPETKFETRFFTVKTDAEGKVFQIDTGHIAAVSSSDAENYADSIIAKGRNEGYSGIYKYLVTEKEYGKLIVFLDCRSELETSMEFLIVSCAIGLLGLIVVLVLVSVFSRRAVKPEIEAMEKQKRFITDAGHEIKTPLAIISANTEALELDIGKNEWTESIKNQINRLNGLIVSLLSLSKTEESRNIVFNDFNLSNAIISAAEEFEIIAENQGKVIIFDVQSEIVLKGNESLIKQLINILMDNAVKYTDLSGIIEVSLHMQKNIILRISNTCSEKPEENLDKLFDRFYRGDVSRSQNGGYGIGLSIAKSIAEAHQADISAEYENGTMNFLTVFHQQ